MIFSRSAQGQERSNLSTWKIKLKTTKKKLKPKSNKMKWQEQIQVQEKRKIAIKRYFKIGTER